MLKLRICDRSQRFADLVHCSATGSNPIEALLGLLDRPVST